MSKETKKSHEKLNQKPWYSSISFAGRQFDLLAALASLKATITNVGMQLGVLNHGSFSVYGAFLLLFTATDGIRLHNLWTDQGQYADNYYHV